MAAREQFFECTLACDNNEYQFHFRAWNAADAERHFRECLVANGLTARGALLIRDSKGNLLRRGTYPDPPVGDAAA